MITIRKPFNPVDPVRITFDKKEGRTKQSFADDCNINKIWKKYQRTGQEPYTRDDGKYSDNTSIDLFDAQILVSQAKSMFEELPSDIRNEFDNNPVKFLEFTENPENMPKMVELGLAKAPTQPQMADPTPDPTPAPVADPAPVAE